MTETPSKKAFYPNLNFLRAIMIIVVIFGHWVEKYHVFEVSFTCLLIFLVISGFLVSTNLIALKEKMMGQQKEPFWYFKTYYGRMALRIVPIYYLYLSILGLLGFVFVTRGLGDFFLFKGNNYIYYECARMPPLKGHLWSLGVQGQFYALWPFVVLLSPAKHYGKIFLAFIGVALSSRIGFYEGYFGLPQKQFQTYMLLPNCLDAFGLGSFLAVFIKRPGAFSNETRNKALCVGLGGVILFLISRSYDYYWYRLFLVPTISIIGLVLIYLLLFDYKGLLGRIFANPIIQYLGERSYGLYVFHIILPYFYYVITSAMINKGIISPTAQITDTWYHYLSMSIGLLIIMYFSWNLIEAPILRLKRFFA